MSGTVVSGVEGIRYTEVASGFDHSLALGPDGQAYSWGSGLTGQLGNGRASDSTAPVPVIMPAGETFTAVSAGSFHSLAIATDGRTYAWGIGNNGQLGHGTTSGSRVPVPVSLPAGVTFTAVSAGTSYSLAIGSDGLIYGWGQGNSGRLGNGHSGGFMVFPTPVRAITPAGVTFTAVSAGRTHSLGIGSDGLTYAWGEVQGGLGNGTFVPARVPVPVTLPAGVTFTAVSAGDYHSLATGSDGQTYAWGWGADGQVGNGINSSSSVPTLVSAPRGVTFTAVSAGARHSLALGSDKQVYAWGSGLQGQLGNGTTTNSSVPVPVTTPEGVTFTAVAAGKDHSFAIGSDGKTYAWGDGHQGRLGNGTTTSSSLPVVVETGPLVQSVTFGGVPGTGLVQRGTTWTATTPAHTCGPVDVEVTSTQLGTTSTTTTPAGFTFGAAPTITTQPEGTEVPADGGQVTLVAEADGDDTPTIQWQHTPTGTDHWTDIPEATGTTLTTHITTATDIRAIFTNCLGTATTTAATITIAEAPINPDPDPVDPDPGPTDPVDPDPTDPVDPDPGPTDPVDPDPTDPVDPDPGPTDPVDPDPNPTDPVDPDPNPTDPVAPDPVDPDPVDAVDPDLTDPSPVLGMPGDPSPVPADTSPAPADASPAPTDTDHDDDSSSESLAASGTDAAILGALALVLVTAGALTVAHRRRTTH